MTPLDRSDLFRLVCRSRSAIAGNPAEVQRVVDAMVATNYQSIVGPVQWTGKPVKNVTKTPLVAGQWKKSGDKLELVITANKPHPNIPAGGKTELLS